MPEALEKKIKERVNKQYPKLSEEKKDSIVYSILRKTGWKPKKEQASYKSVELSLEDRKSALNIFHDLFKEVK